MSEQISDSPLPAYRGNMLILRAEGLAALAGATYAYQLYGGGWLLFALLFFAPDVFMLGYLINKRIGAHIYNAGHSYLTPAFILLLAYAMSSFVGISIALIWIAHIGFDRAMGYGLKYESGFQDTHLSMRARQAA